MKLVAILVLVLVLAPGLAAAGPDGQVTWAVHTTLVPTYFDPAETTIITAFMEKMTTKTFKSTFERDQYIKANPAAGSGTVQDAAKRLSYDPERIRRLIADGKLGALIVPLKDGTQDIIIPESEIQRYGVTRD